VNLRRSRPSIPHLMDRLRHATRSALSGSALSGAALSALLLLAGLLFSSVAEAQARVRVQVRGGEATVTLTAESGGGTYSCRTQNGSCVIDGVSTGPYVASAEPTGAARAPLPRRVMVGGSGEVTVHLRLRDPE